MDNLRVWINAELDAKVSKALVSINNTYGRGDITGLELNAPQYGQVSGKAFRKITSGEDVRRFRVMHCPYGTWAKVVFLGHMRTVHR